MPAQRVLIQYGLHISIKAVETAPHIDRIQGYKYAGCQREAQHGSPQSRRASASTDRDSLHRTIIPVGPVSSTAKGIKKSGLTSGNVTSFSITGDGWFVMLRVSFSHLPKVDTGMPDCLENARRVRPLCSNCSTMRIRCCSVVRRCFVLF